MTASSAPPAAPRLTRRRSEAFRRRGFAGVAFVGAVLAVVGLISAPAVAAPGAASTTITSYAVNRPICAAPTHPDEFTCMAYRRVTVAKGTPGAYRYSVPKAARGPAGGVTPAAIAAAYRINPNGATNQTVAIVDWNDDPKVRADLNHFDRHYHFPVETAKSFRVVNGAGKTAPLPVGDTDAAAEISLDVQAVRAVCRKCKIILVEAAGANSGQLAAAENTAVRLGAKIVSNSFGAPERRGHKEPSKLIKAFNHKGVVITAASGDDGWDFWDLANADPLGYSSYAPATPSFPASLPSVVSVGGTRLSFNSDGSRAGESVWNENGANDARGNAAGDSLGASGGGCSTQFAAPSWQRSLAAYQRAGCQGKRLSVDVSADADPDSGLDVFDSYGGGGWTTIGGTSLAAPLVAGMWALAGGAHGMAAPVQALYQNYRYRSSVLHDVTVGGNAWCGGATTTGCADAADEVGGVNNPNYAYGALVDCSFPRTGSVTTVPAKNSSCNATVGYDGASGVGTPKGLGIFRTTRPTVRIAASSKHGSRRITFTASVHAVVSGARVAKRVWNWGDHTSTVATGSATSHRFAKAGSYRVQVTVTDSLGQRTAVVRAIKVP